LGGNGRVNVERGKGKGCPLDEGRSSRGERKLVWESDRPEESPRKKGLRRRIRNVRKREGAGQLRKNKWANCHITKEKPFATGARKKKKPIPGKGWGKRISRHPGGTREPKAFSKKKEEPAEKSKIQQGTFLTGRRVSLETNWSKEKRET